MSRVKSLLLIIGFTAVLGGLVTAAAIKHPDLMRQWVATDGEGAAAFSPRTREQQAQFRGAE